MGSFDGVHLGHRRIFEYMREAAERLDGETVVVTFDPHPQQVLHPEREFFTINTLEENAGLIGAEGIGSMVVLPFTKAFSQLSFQDFLFDVPIVAKMPPRRNRKNGAKVKQRIAI